MPGTGVGRATALAADAATAATRGPLVTLAGRVAAEAVAAVGTAAAEAVTVLRTRPLDAGPAAGWAAPLSTAPASAKVARAWGRTDAANEAYRFKQELREQPRVDGQREGGVRKARMAADLVVPKALAPQGLGVVDVGRTVIALDGVHAHRAFGPFAVEPSRDVGEALLVAAMVADQDDVAKPVLAKAARRIFERGLERGFGDADSASKAHVRGRRIDRAFGHVCDNGRDECVTEAR